MSRNKLRPSLIGPSLVGLALLALPAGCADYAYLNNNDSVVLGAGDSIAFNQAVHTIDPWPAGVYRKHIPSNSDRAVVIYKRYEAGPAAKGSGGASAPVTVNVNSGG
jgi:hypothetical protein